MTDKLYYTIGQVAEMLQVNPSLLRYYETQFPSLRPAKNSKGTRRYTDRDIDLLRQILHLTRDCGYTLDGAREQLRLSSTPDTDAQLVKTLTEARQFLAELKAIL